MQEAAASRIDQRAAEMELTVGERQAVDLEAKDALARRCSPAEAVGRQRSTPPRTVPSLSRSSSETRGGSIAASQATTSSTATASPDGECGPRLAVGVEEPRRDDPRLAAPPFAQPCGELVGAPLVGEQAAGTSAIASRVSPSKTTASRCGAARRGRRAARPPGRRGRRRRSCRPGP